ncbi:MAG: YggU family protein [Candidatus Diapherotrites archaeon]|uniref:UPF0235 protein JW744_02240 n=1 Tax=Candidatus Iainarchaeum sp. TaxID=3101447 RepID=A0A939C8S5_9ARCH|nr:YggU family protein [Candidatus Diapherotrites archaeon]
MVVKGFEKNLIETGQGTIVPLHVLPGSSKAAVLGMDEWRKALKVRLQAKAEKGKANKELLEKLEAFFGAEVEIASGEKSQQKKLLVHAPKKRVVECLQQQGSPGKKA